MLKDGTFFGTLCAIDPAPARIDDEQVIGTFKLFAELIATQLQLNARFNESVRNRMEMEARLRQARRWRRWAS